MQTTNQIDPLVYLNGEITPLSEAKISVLDRGFIFGDGVYEVIPVYQGKMFRDAQHLARLFRNLDAIKIVNPYTKQQWYQLITTIIDHCDDDDQMVYLQVTRGVAKRAHAFPKDVKPTVFIMSGPLVVPSLSAREQGVACVSMEDKRWLRCDIKSISLLGNVLAAQYAVEHDALETIQFRDGYLTEASSSNVWIVKNGCVIGPPKDNLILEGIRCGLLEELCTKNNISLTLTPITRDAVFGADEVLLTSATKEILSVVSIDGQVIGNKTPGPIYKKLYQAYQEAKYDNSKS